MRKLVVISVMWIGCKRGDLDQVDEGDRIVSPSGAYVAVVDRATEEPNALTFHIEDAKHHVEYVATDHWLERFVLAMMWDAEGRLWCYSGDVGTEVWDRQPDGTWRGHDETSVAWPMPAPIQQHLDKILKPRSRAKLSPAPR